MRAYRKIDDHFEVKIEKGRMVVLGVGAGLTLLLVFLVGVLVGKGLWGGRAEVLVASSVPSSAPQGAGAGDKAQLGFYTELQKPDSAAPQSLTPKTPPAPDAVGETVVPGSKGAEAGAPATPAVREGEASLPPLRDEPAVDAPKKPVERTLAEAARPPVSKPATDPKPAASPKPTVVPKPTPTTKPAEAAKVAPPPKAAEAPKSTVPSPTKGTEAEKAAAKSAADKGKPAVEAKLGAPSYTVQVGSFRDRASADDQAKKIASQGVTAQVVSAPMEGRTWFRVQVGRYDTRADAESYYQKKLRPKGVEGFVTQR